MNFSCTVEQLDLKKKTITFAQQQLHNNDLIERDRHGLFSFENWRKCADFGIQSLSVPAAYSGRDEIDFLTAILMMEGLGYGCRDNGLTFALNAQMWTVQLPIVHFGTPEQKEKFLPPLCRGEMIGAHAVTELESGSDAFSMKTLASKDVDGYRLNGMKRFVSLAPVANLALVFASTDLTLGKWGISAFLVELDSPGCTVSPMREKMGLRTVPYGEITFEDCFVPASNRIGPEGAGASLSNHSLEWERCSILASHLGAMDWQLEETIAHAKSRQQFGQPIGKFQSVSNRIAEMKLRLETSRLLLYKVAWMKANGQQAMLDSALLKLHLSESFVQSSLDAVRIHGGDGYTTEMGIERDLRDSVGGVIYAGTSDIQRNIVARLLGV